MPKPNYQKRGYLERARELARRAKPGTLNVIEVLHDPDCAIWRGRPCNCVPDMRMREVQP